MDVFVASLGADPASELDPCYQGYFRCFNEGQYYEAHDVLEHLWLQGGRAEPNHAFYKGLIQLAGGFVHLRKQHEHPGHAKHGKRLRPATRLFALATANLSPYGPRHLGLDVDAACALGADTAAAIIHSEYTRNPWSPDSLPQMQPR